jgi:branched-chain amino acid transport system permease protein
MINVSEHATDFFSLKKKTNCLRWISLFVLLFFLTILPFVLPNRFYIRLINEILIYALLAMSLDVLFGYTGMLSFMHNAYLGISAYLVGLFLKHISSSSVWLALMIGLIGTSFIALPVGWIQVRTGGLAFALLTLAFGMMFFTVAWKCYGLTGGSDCLMGIPLPDIRFGEWSVGSLNNFTLMYLFTLFIVAICVVLTWRIIHSPFGAVLEAIRENPVRASFIGINLRKYKLIGWMLACGLASVSGALFVLFKGYMGPETMSAFAGGAVLMMVLLGGHGTLWGPILGAAIFIFVQDYISTMTEHWEIFIGFVVVLLVLFMPRGVAGIWDSLLRFKRVNQK